MEKFLDFMGDIIDVQQKITSLEYKKLSESANSLYQECVAYRQQKANDHAKERQRVGFLADMTIDAMVCKIVRDEPWDTLTATVMKSKLLEQLAPVVTADMIDMSSLKKIMDREVRLLVELGRRDPAARPAKRVKRDREGQ